MVHGHPQSESERRDRTFRFIPVDWLTQGLEVGCASGLDVEGEPASDRPHRPLVAELKLPAEELEECLDLAALVKIGLRSKGEETVLGGRVRHVQEEAAGQPEYREALVHDRW